MHLGAIRSMAATASVLASALGPVSMGAMMDLGLSDVAICLMFAGAILATTAGVFAGLARHRVEARRRAPASSRCSVAGRNADRIARRTQLAGRQAGIPATQGRRPGAGFR